MSIDLDTGWLTCRLMTMSPLYPCGRPCSRGTHNETVINLALFSSIINGIMMESRLRISIPWGSFKFFNRIEIYNVYTVIIVIHKSRNLIGTLGIAKFGLNRARFFRVIL